MMESARKVADLSSPASSMLSNDGKSTSSWNAFSLIPFLQGVSSASSSLHPSTSLYDSPFNAWSAAMAAYASFMPHVSPLPGNLTTRIQDNKDSSRGECNQGSKLNLSSFYAAFSLFFLSEESLEKSSKREDALSTQLLLRSILCLQTLLEF